MKILFAGDLGFRGVGERLSKSYIENVFSEVRESIKDADFRMLNLETLFNEDFSPIVKSGPNNYALPGYMYSLKYMGIDMVGLANNHTGDYGPGCVLYNLDYLTQNGIRYCGAGANVDEAYKAGVFEKDGMRVSVIAVCENEYGTADENSAGSAGFSLRRTYDSIKAEKEKGNYTVVFFHGGNEGNPFPSPKKVELYRLFAEFGADVVIGMHTHCPQGYEIYKGKPIIYSMGNFFFSPNPASPPPPDDAYYCGYMCEIEFSPSGVNFRPIPYKYDLDRMTVLSGKKLKAFESYVKTLSAPICDSAEIERLFKGWCLVMGPAYASHARFDSEMIGSKALSCHLKNAFCCEAHNELLSEYSKLYYNGITEENEKYRDKIIALMKFKQ